VSVRLIQGDCRDVLRTLEANSVDAVITDPPYGLGFMDREWDTFRPETVQRRAEQRERKQSGSRSSRRWPTRGGTTQGGGPSVEYDESLEGNRAFQAWCEEWARECLRVLKPGGHVLAFGGPRTEHRLVCGIEDAGFQIRDKLVWLFGSGYPKSYNLCRCPEPRPAELDRWHWTTCAECGGRIELGTALKPAWEPIVMARKPFRGTVLRNVGEWGVGALNIDGSRLVDALNRWPPNACLDEAAAATLDLAVGERRSGGNPTRRKAPKHRDLYGEFVGQPVCAPLRGADSGGVSRFFYCPKPSRRERNAGIEGMPRQMVKLRDDLTPEQRAWVLSELAAHGVVL
jgi:hypothetical protein